MTGETIATAVPVAPSPTPPRPALWPGLALAMAGSIAFSGKAIIVKLAYRHGVDAVRGAMARLVENSAEVRYVAFSIATRSLPEGFAPDTLAREVREATTELGIPAESLTVHDFDVRTFPDHRQEILELLIEIWNDWEPDCVFMPSLHDVHQDHQTIAQEGLRAFKRTTVLGYEIPWNNFDFSYQAYFALREGARRAQGGRTREVRITTAPSVCELRLRLERRAHTRHQREPRVRRGVPGVPRRQLSRLSSDSAARRARRTRHTLTA